MTTVENLTEFVEAEPEHQDYASRNPDNPYIKAQAQPKVEKLAAAYPDLLKTDKPVLNDMQHYVTKKNGTEPAFQNEYWNHKEAGIYVDIITGEPLFSSTDKYDSGTGWPSFTKSLKESEIVEKTDKAYGMTRVEVRSKSGDNHLGHVFDDGPKDKGGTRYCINSASLKFIPKAELQAKGYGEYLSLFDKAE